MCLSSTRPHDNNKNKGKYGSTRSLSVCADTIRKSPSENVFLLVDHHHHVHDDDKSGSKVNGCMRMAIGEKDNNNPQHKPPYPMNLSTKRNVYSSTSPHYLYFRGGGGGGGLFNSTLHLLLLTVSSAVIISSVQGVGTNDTKAGHHRCYVCLPGDKSTSEARDILNLFPPESHQDIPDCAAFGSHNAHQFEFTCPPSYTGCLRRALGTNQILVARTCSQFQIDDCKVANSVEYCYCSGHLCNGEKSMTGQNFTGGILTHLHTTTTLGNKTNQNSRPFQARGGGYWKEGETDDEDLLGPNTEDKILDNEDEGGSGDFEGDSDSDTDQSSSRNNNQNSQHNSNSSHGQQQVTRGGSNIPASNNKGNRKSPGGTGGNSQSSGAYSIFNNFPFLVLILVTIILPSHFLQHLQSSLSSS